MEAELYELYSAAITGGTPVKLSGSLISGGDVLPDGFAISSDSIRFVYRADQDADEQVELYVSREGSAVMNWRDY